ncbi:MAG TPA: hypothetical protein VG755_07120 [Nannocystaceae bacterium]|nr:hypothetical protein [Nannocystaceae bacterium]
MDRRASLVFALVACAHVSGKQGIPGGPCGPEIRGSADITARWSIVMVGELHGTHETPAAFGRLVCRAAERAYPAGVLVGLEIPRGDQAAIDAALAAADDETARSRLLATTHFADEFHDGRDSEAMLALLLELRRQRRAGLDIEVVAFDMDLAAFTPASDRDLEMARAFGEAIDAHPDTTVLAYAGNLHARRRAAARLQRHPPMAERLLADHPELVTLGFASAGGSYWACEDDTCGVHQGQGTDRGAEPFVELSDEQGDAYDGFLYVGAITASAPAKP